MLSKPRKANTPSLFISYSEEDRSVATALGRALKKLGLEVWLDMEGIKAGEDWFRRIQKSIRRSRGLIVLVTSASAESEWVTYEYAFAMGARIPVVAVRVDEARVPRPLRALQVVKYPSNAKLIAESINDGILTQARTAAKKRINAPTLMAKFQEVHGTLVRTGQHNPQMLGIDLWVEEAPRQTRTVAFEIPDLGFKDREWSVNRKRGKSGAIREFLTDDITSWGNVEILARGIGSDDETWSAHSTLYKALRAYYRVGQKSQEIRVGLKQIRDN